MFPLGIVGLSDWLGATALVILITTELVSPLQGEASVLIDRRKLEAVGLVLGVIYLVYVVIQFAMASL